MPGIFERLLNWVLLGLWPPIPNELRSDYVQAQADEQAKRRMRYAVHQLRWKRVVSGVAIVMLIKWMWELGFLAWLGMGAGVATAGDVNKITTEVHAAQQAVRVARAENNAFRAEYRTDQLNARLRVIASEKVQIQIAQAEAERAGHRPLSLLATRLSELVTEEGEINRQLAALDSKPL